MSSRMISRVGDIVLLAFDVGERRIGVARAVVPPRIAEGLITLTNDASLPQALTALYARTQPETVVVGRPRNQAGEMTAQTRAVERWVNQFLVPLKVPIVWQDESLTSVQAEQYLGVGHRAFTKADVDKKAAELILSDYLETLTV